MRILSALILCLVLASPVAAQELFKSLNGTWAGDLGTVQFDVENGLYSGIAMGEEFEKKLTFVKEMGNSVVFLSGENKITATIREDGSVLMAKEGGVPLIYKRHQQ